MNEFPLIRVRRSIAELQSEYLSGKDKKPLEDLMRAWKGIQELPSCDPYSFWTIGGYHGEPFRGAGWGNASWWGGYCNHGNVLFPTWHRAYLHRLEQALRSIPGCEAVSLPYWDETSPDSLANGVPEVFLWETFELDGQTVPNPLRSYTFPNNIVDNLAPMDPETSYTKLSGYSTVRFPLSGLVGTASETAASAAHNALYPTVAIQNAYLNYNVGYWLGQTVDIGGNFVSSGVAWMYGQCLQAPNYTVFSNVSSAQQWNEDHANLLPGEDPQDTPAYDKNGPNGPVGDPNNPKGDIPGNVVVPLESPHNSIHLAVGGFDISNAAGGPQFDADTDLPFATPLPNDIGANGDMGENDTASFDPIFYFHHCFVDRMFWLWQTTHCTKVKQPDGTTLDVPCTERLEIIDGYPGTNSVDSQGPTPGVAGGTWLTLESPLVPFKQDDGAYFTSHAVTNIDRLGYAYDHASIEGHQATAAAMLAKAQSLPPAPTLRVSGLSRASTPGSFLVSVFAPVKGPDGAFVTDESGNVKKQMVGHEAILSRWHVMGCANCQTHLDVKAFVPLHGLTHAEARSADLEVHVHTRNKAQPGQPPRLRLVGTPASGRAVSARPVPAELASTQPAMVQPAVAPAAVAVGGRISLPVAQPSLVHRSVRLEVR